MQETGSKRARPRDWVGLVVLALPCLLYSMDLTVLNLAVPHISADLEPSGTQLLWIVDIYGFLVAASLITMGTLGDRIGRRKLLLIGAAAFGTVSVLAALAWSTEVLIGARALLGVAAATLAPSTLSLIRNMFEDARQRTFAVGVWIASFSAGGAIGPVLGGLMLEHFWWGSVFLLNVPVMLLLLVLGPILLPEFRDPSARRMDLQSVTLSLMSVLAVVYGIKRAAAGDASLVATLTIAAGLAAGAAFVYRQQRLPIPWIDLSLFRRRAFSVSLAVNVLGFFIAFGTFLFIAQYLQLVLGMSPLEAGLWTAPSGLAFVAGSLLTPLLARRIRPTHLIAGGFALAAVGFAVLTRIGGSLGPSVVVTGYAILSLGLAPVFTMATDLIVGTAPPERAGMASGLSETSAELGGALGIAILGSLVTALYRGFMSSAATAGAAATTAATHESLGGALARAKSLPADMGAALADAARTAFTEAVVMTASVSAALALAAAIVTMTLLRDVRSRDPSTEGAT